MPWGRRSRRRLQCGGRRGGWPPEAARPPDGWAAPKPPRPAASAAIAFTAASTGVPMTAIAVATAASPLHLCGVGGRG